MKTLPRSFYERNTVLVARDLLGKYLIHCSGKQHFVGRIVEVEAYLGQEDLACHSSKGLTKRTEVMFGSPGHAYIYLIYGMYYCMNIVTEPVGKACAVLIRAIEPIRQINQKTEGPGLLCKAMAIDKSLNQHDLTENSHFYVAASDDDQTIKIVRRPRIGVDYAKNWAKKKLRFYIKNNLYISKP